MADEQSKPPYNKTIVPKGLDWGSLLDRDGEELERLGLAPFDSFKTLLAVDGEAANSE